MIGTKDVKSLFKTPFHFVQKIGDVRGKVGGPAIFTDDDPVFFIAEGGSTEPGCPILYIEMTVFLKPLDGMLDRTAVLKFFF